MFSLWWIYFAEVQHLTSDDFGRTFLWAYGHLFLFAAIALMGAGLAALFDVQTGHSKTDSATVGWFIGAPLAVAYLTLWLVRDQFMALGWRALSLPVGALAVLISMALTTASPLMFAALAIATLIWRVPFTSAEGQHL